MPTLIGVYGKARSGKDTAAEYLAARMQLTKTSFAEPIKQMLKAGFGDHFHEGDRSGICPETGKSYREMMQTLGTEWGRHLMHPDLWVRMVAKQWNDMKVIRSQMSEEAWKLYKGPKGLVVSDVRFRSEASWIRSSGGIVIDVYGRGGDTTVGIPGHISEAGLAPWEVDLGVNNNGTVEQLHGILDAIPVFLNLEPAP